MLCLRKRKAQDLFQWSNCVFRSQLLWIQPRWTNSTDRLSRPPIKSASYFKISPFVNPTFQVTAIEISYEHIDFPISECTSFKTRFLPLCDSLLESGECKYHIDNLLYNGHNPRWGLLICFREIWSPEMSHRGYVCRIAFRWDELGCWKDYL